MPQAPIYSEPLDRTFSPIRCTESMARAVSLAAERHGVSVSDVVRACIARGLGLHSENSDIITRMFRKAAREEGNG